jgi:hypothetical protein
MLHLHLPAMSRDKEALRRCAVLEFGGCGSRSESAKRARRADILSTNLLELY